MNNLFRSFLITATLGGLAGLAQGCVISLSPLDCSECGNTGCNSQLVGGECKCDQGYEWAHPDDAADYECDPTKPKGGDANCGGIPNNPIHLEGSVCVCDPGYNWCLPNDDNDLTCCVDDNQAPGTGGVETEGDDVADTGGPGTADETGDETGTTDVCEQTEAPWNGVEPDPADCTEDGLVFCSNNSDEGPAGSRYWECVGGAWVESATAGDESCQFDGYDFSYGCEDNGEAVLFVCGSGPGTACSGPECDGCGGDGDQILFCDAGKLGGDSCNRICTEDGDGSGVTYDFGSCVVNESGVGECACCDSGEEGCPV